MASNISTSNIWPNYSTKNVQAAAREPVKELGKDQFLQILITQLRNQDPMQPMQDTEFIGQMAQFSSLEQMVNMSSQMSALRQSAGMVAALIGKEVTWQDTDYYGVTQTYVGVVDSVLWKNNVQYVQVGNAEVPIDEIKSISSPSTTDGSATASEPEVE
ncbi:MAG: flagellar hook assembly protein FlgD [Candidatus Cohnella colombiensis]|uniref:Flagellar hook assembly protein FlgD n=1 Tax=Candidatus Cohnella colombiensis TaxID=3121368 RepID=A0AA95F0D5_9BACL|nr:MAG: flagellar hook assembly protein FlgD [Cohnella sp.]